jgi:DNA-binding beta-propeller fold protein YncE
MPQRRHRPCAGEREEVWYPRERTRIVGDGIHVSISTQVEIGTDFVGYRIEELIGHGGMGVVYRAYDLRLKRPVALKLIAPELALDERFHSRFARETELAMSLEHPNVVPVYDAGDVDGRFYLAMRLVDGADLGALLRSEGALDPARALVICGQVANALDAAHAKDLVHRDVKPSNVLLDASEHVYMADFGLTRRLEEQGAQPGDGRSVGTPAYLAPEQIEAGRVDGRADVYSLGCLLYECLTGEPPFSQGSRLAMAWAHLEEEPPSASARNSDLPGRVDAVIRKAMAKAPDDRYPTCSALIAAAEEALELRRPPILRGRLPLILAAAAILAVAVGALVAALVGRDDGQTAASVPVVRENTLVRIDPATNAVDAVVEVGRRPFATAVAGRTVWVYNDGPRTISEVDAATGVVRRTTSVSAAPTDADAFVGPVLAADPAGAWMVGLDGRRRPLLVRVFAGARRMRRYRLDREPRAVAVGFGAVWVVVRGARDNQVLRFDPATGAVTKRTRFPKVPRIDGLAVGLGGVWVVAPSSAILYRIDPRSAAVTARIDLGGRAARPAVVLGEIWVGLSDSGGRTIRVDPRTVSVIAHLSCCPPEWGYFAAGHDSIWDYDTPTGTVVRWSSETYQVAANIGVTHPPFYDGLCLTSIAAGAGAVWVTVAAHAGHVCRR